MISCIFGLILSGRELWLNQFLVGNGFCFGSQKEILNVILSMQPVEFLHTLWASGTNCAGGDILIFGIPITLMYIVTYIVLLFATACQIRYTVRHYRRIAADQHEY